MALYEIKHRSTGSVLFSLECASLKICVKAAWESRVNLARANLARAYLSGAYHVIHLGCPNGWSNAFAWLKNGMLMVQIGCRSKTIAEARTYWTGKQDRREVMAALDYAETVAKLREWEIA